MLYREKVYITFSDPANFKNTGVIFLKSLICSILGDNKIDIEFLSFTSMVKRYFSKDADIAIFLPINYKCFFAKKNDLILLPDDSFRSITSIIKNRIENKRYLKALYQCFSLCYMFFLHFRLASNKKLTVSIDDMNSLLSIKFIKNVSYIPHPIQSELQNEASGINNREYRTICFINLVEHYSVNPLKFLDVNYIDSKYSIIFHGSYGAVWLSAFNAQCGNHEKVKCIGYVKDFSEFFYGVDIVVMPLNAGAGIKNILLNSIYEGKIVFGTEEAFSGIPTDLARPFYIHTMSDLNILLNRVNNLQLEYVQLRSYILKNNSYSLFSSCVMSHLVLD